MQKRIEISQNDSDFAYFFDLILYGEMLTKITALFLVANINNDVDRNRYRYEYNIVRAGGIGDFANIINDIITGNAANFLSPAIRDKEIKEISCKAEMGTWQRKALEKLSQCLVLFDVQSNKLTPKSSLKIWFANFSTLRNKTKGHGATTTEICSKVCPLLAESIDLVFENLSLFQRQWAFLHQNYSGKYRVAKIGSECFEFDYLKRENKARFSDGIYCYTDQPRLIKLIFSNPDLINSNYRMATSQQITSSK